MSVKINLGVHLGFAINRYPETSEWAKLISEELGVKQVKFVSDLLQPNYPDNTIEKEIIKIKETCKTYDIKLCHTFTSPRWNFFGNPNEDFRVYWLWWFKKFALISKKLGAKSTGSLLGIYSVYDYKKRKEYILNEIIKNWYILAEYAEEIGLEYLTWEPMSIPRELGEGIKETQLLMELLNNSKSPPAIPILLCLDVDHGDRGSNNPDDTNPYEWIRLFGKQSPTVDLKQVTKNLFGHKPFTPEYNKVGLINPEELIKAFEESGAEETTLFLELSFRERYPYDNNVISDLKTSVDYWKNYISI